MKIDLGDADLDQVNLILEALDRYRSELDLRAAWMKRVGIEPTVKFVADIEYLDTVHKQIRDVYSGRVDSAEDARTIKTMANALNLANRVLLKTRFAGMDQNPKGINDVVGSAALLGERWRKKNPHR